MIKYEIVFLSMSKIHGCIILNNLKVNDKERKKEIVHEENRKVMLNYVIHFNSIKWDLVYYLVSLDFRYLQFQKKKNEASCNRKHQKPFVCSTIEM